jgi:microcin C transport system permease protein
MMIRLNPLTVLKLRRFIAIRRGFISFLIFIALLLLSAGAELIVNSRALVVYYNGRIILPTYGRVRTGREFGLDYAYEANYRDLARRFHEADEGNFVIMPPVPYGPLETDLKRGSYPPFPPDWQRGHYLGTDKVGRDVLARLVYGFRISIVFSLILLFINYIVGIGIGSLMGYLGGGFDLFLQRVIEIWSNIPFLYAVMIISTVVVPKIQHLGEAASIGALLLVMVFFGWMNMTWYMRTASYREKARDYITAARALGASNGRIIVRHLIPNSISIIVTFIPFSISSGVTSLTALDFLGFGVPAPIPSWGELLNQGVSQMSAPWIVTSVVTAMIIVLLLVNLIGESIREAFDPRKHTVYE